MPATTRPGVWLSLAMFQSNASQARNWVDQPRQPGEMTDVSTCWVQTLFGVPLMELVCLSLLRRAQAFGLSVLVLESIDRFALSQLNFVLCWTHLDGLLLVSLFRSCNFRDMHRTKLLFRLDRSNFFHRSWCSNVHHLEKTHRQTPVNDGQCYWDRHYTDRYERQKADAFNRPSDGYIRWHWSLTISSPFCACQ